MESLEILQIGLSSPNPPHSPMSLDSKEVTLLSWIISLFFEFWFLQLVEINKINAMVYFNFQIIEVYKNCLQRYGLPSVWELEFRQPGEVAD